MPPTPPVSRRAVLSAGGGLLASIGVNAVWPGAAHAVPAPAAPSGDLALYRPVSVSSTAYAPTPAWFAVDGIARPGVKGTGWRAGAGDPQWITVDLQARCRIDSVVLTFEAVRSDPPFDGNYGEASSDQVLSSAAVAFSLDVSADGHDWTTVYRTTDGSGGVQTITLAAPVEARWMRLTSTERSNTNPVGLNGFQVFGAPLSRQPAATGWTDWAGGNTRPAPGLSVSADGTVPVESGWALTMDDFAGANPAAIDVDTRDWLPARVPGTVLATLVELGHLPDPVGGFENLKIPEALSRHAWWYRRSFRLPHGFDASAGRRIWLEFDGINHEATTWVNGTEVGTVTHPFARGALEVTEALRGRTDHVLAVRVTPMPHPGTPGDKSANGHTFVQGGKLYFDSPTYLAVSGWDWMPAVRDRVSGIWNHVRLRSTGDVVIGDAHVTTKLPHRRLAELTVSVPVRNAAGVAAKVTVRAAFDDVRLEHTVTLPAGEWRTVRFPTVKVRNPKLWWPHGYGDPNLHDLRVTATVSGRTSDTRTVRFGIREFTYDFAQPVVISPPAVPPLTFVDDRATQTVTFEQRRTRYVRVQTGARATGWGVSMWSLSVQNGPAGPDLALRKPAAASSAEHDDRTADRAVDGDTGTRWSSAYQDNEWIQVDLGAPADIDRVIILWEQAYAQDFRIQVSDDAATWTDVKAVSNEVPLGNRGTQVVTMPTQRARYLRLTGGKRVTDYGISIWELAVAAGSGPNLAWRRPVTASGDDGNPAADAVDGDPRTRWSSRFQDNEWIQVDLGSVVDFDTVTVVWEQAYAREFVLSVSVDGQTWTEAKAVDNKAVELAISVNGVRVFARGGNWGWDELLRRADRDYLRTVVAMHRDMNFTMIRNWLGSSNRSEFFAACDEFGIMVWNDFWEAGPFIERSETYDRIVADTIRRYRHHPSIAVWCGANEEYPPAAINAGLVKAVAEEDPEIIYVPSSNAGIVSGSGPWHWIDPATYPDASLYKAGVLGFHTEIGMPVIPHVETMRNLVGDQPAWPPSEVWNHHDWSPIGNQHTAGYQQAIDDRLSPSSSIEEFTVRAQFVNYENHRAMFEAWNAKLWQNASGLLLWMSHPAWYSTVWQTYDYDLDVNGAYYGARKGCEPVHVQADPGSWLVRAVNHTAAELPAVTVTATAYNLDGTRLGPPQSHRLSVAASSTTAAFTLAPAATGLHLVRLEMRDARGRVLSENTYWRYAAPADMRALNSLPASRLRVRPEDASGGHHTVTVTNVGRTVAAMVRVALRDGRGDRVLPAQYSDNYFWLLPGESRPVTARHSARAHEPRGIHVTAEAYR